jgi:hypothetical protein
VTDNFNEPTNPESSTAEPTPPKQKRVRGSAINRLCKDTAQTVRDNSESIAKSLLALTIKGDIRCARLLIDLIEKDQQKSKRKSNRAHKIIEALENERQWDPTKDRKFSEASPMRTLIRT